MSDLRETITNHAWRFACDVLADYGVSPETVNGDCELYSSCQAEADAVIEALPRCVPDLRWHDFGDRGAKATAWGQANYLITKWSDGKCELVESYPGHQGARIGNGFYPSIKAAKYAANAHNRAQIIRSLGIETSRKGAG